MNEREQLLTGGDMRPEAYDLIDRFLRNNLSDMDYAEYSQALGLLWESPQASPATVAQEDELRAPSYAELVEAAEKVECGYEALNGGIEEWQAAHHVVQRAREYLTTAQPAPHSGNAVDESKTNKEAQPVKPHLGSTFEPTMDIYSRPGTQIRFRAGGGYDWQKKDALEAGFVMNGLYTVKRCDVVHPGKLVIGSVSMEPVWVQPNHLEQARKAPFFCRLAPTQMCPDFVPMVPATQLQAAEQKGRREALEEAHKIACASRQKHRTWAACAEADDCAKAIYALIQQGEKR